MLSNAEKNRLKNQYGSWALVTGASSGIGKELAERLAESGLNLILVARRQTVLAEMAAKMVPQYDIQVKTIAADLSVKSEVERVIAETKDFEIGLLVASAGFGTSGYFTETPLHDELEMLNLNCSALLMMTHYFSKIFKDKKRGGIILMSSMVAFQGTPFAAHYAATKAYVQSLGEAIALELKPFGVDVLAAAPGPVSSGFEQQANMKMDMSMKPSEVAIPILKALGRKSTVLPGFLTKFLVYSLRTVPRWGKVRIMKLVMGGMTQHQRG